MRDGLTIRAVDVHAGGEPGRVIVEGLADMPGDTIAAKTEYFRNNLDHIRQAMLREPRGYPASNCNLLVAPTTPGVDTGCIIMEQAQYPSMSGSNMICVATVLVETGIVAAVEPVTRVRVETVAGIIDLECRVDGGKVVDVSFTNVPAFAVHLDQELVVPHLGRIRVDVAYGGMFYVIADANDVDCILDPANGSQIARYGEMIKAAAAREFDVAHPIIPGIGGIRMAQLCGPPTVRGASAKNAVIVSAGELQWDRPDTWRGVLDRSPCGTGTSARMAALHAKGALGLHEEFVHEGILGTTFRGELIEEVAVGGCHAVVPRISGRGWITSSGDYFLDPDDPSCAGLRVGDIWPLGN